MVDEQKLVNEEQQWEKDKPLLKRQIKINKEKKKIKDSLKNKNKLTTTKWLILFLFINCTIIEIFTGIVTIQSIYLATLIAVAPDFTPLVALIGAVVGEVMGFAVYAIKSTKENTESGIVYMQAKHALEKQNNEDNAVG